jgi:3-hydroxybutyrate dehydrogenase
MVSNAGIQIVHPLEEFSYAEWKRMMAIHVDGAFLTTKASLPHMYAQGSGSLIYMGSVHSKEASLLKAPYCRGQARIARPGAHGSQRKAASAVGGRTSSVPGFVRTPLVDKQIPSRRARWASPRRR